MMDINLMVKEANIMGLDNGIRIKTENELPDFEVFPKSFYGNNIEYEVAYWRKCYGIRSNILAIYRANHHIETKNTFNFALDVNDLKDIQWFLHQCAISERYFNDQVNSIWDYEELKSKLEQQVKNLELVITQKLKLGDGLKVFFYDSY